jgi:hypothetical protein
MKSFTIKDLINYNNPCFSCDSMDHTVSFYDSSLNLSKLVTIVTKKNVTITLKYKFNNQSQLFIDLNTNKFFTSENCEPIYYDKLYLSVLCNFCGSVINSDTIIHDDSCNRILPTSIKHEIFYISSNDRRYIISSHTPLGVTSIRSDSFHIKIPLLLKNEFGSKQDLIDKINLYITFS